MRAKLGGAIFLAVMAPLLLAGWAAVVRNESDLRQAAHEEARRSGELARVIMQERGERLLAAAQAMAAGPRLREAVLARDRTALLEVTREQQARLGGPTVTVADAESTVLVRAYQPEQFGEKVTTKGHRLALQGIPLYSTEVGAVRGLALRGYGPVQAEGRTIGVVIVAQNLDQEFVTGLRDPLGLRTFAVQGDRSVVGARLAPAAAEAIARVVGARVAAPAGSSTPAFNDFGAIEGAEHALYAWGLADPEGEIVGYLGIGRPLDDVRRAQDLFRRAMAAAGALAVFGAAALAALLSAALLRPLERIVAAARRITAGQEAPIPGAGRDDELGELAGALSGMVTSLRETNQEVARRSGELRSVLDATSEAILMVAPDRSFVVANERVRHLFGIDPREVVGRTLADLAPLVARVFADPEAFSARVAGSAKTPEGSFTEVVRQRWPAPRELELYSAPATDADGGFMGRLYVFRDVTREREVDRLKSEFVGLVSHELRTPLTSIKGYVDLVIEGEAGEVTEEQKEFLGIAKSNADRLVALINDLLDVSRIESGRVQLNRAPRDANALIRQAASALRPQLQGKGQRLELKLAEDLPAVDADADRLTQVLVNLLSNAHKYTPQGGSIRVSSRADGGVVRVDVQDTGIGMDEADLSRLFEKFFRSANSAAQFAGGTGLGLAITKSIVELHGGRIWAESALGQGSTFSFTVPQAGLQTGGAAAATDGQEGGEATLERRGKRVLVVDDEPDIANLLRRYLERGGYAVEAAGSGVEALRLAQENHPDLITLDVLLPDTDGFAVLEALKTDPATAEIPVVMVSIVPDEGRGTLLGAEGWIAKPVGERELLTSVDRVVARVAEVAALGGATLVRQPCTPQELAEAIAKGLAASDDRRAPA